MAEKKCEAIKLWERNGKSDFKKQLSTLVKSQSSPLFCGADKKNIFFRAIYDLLSLGCKGLIKKDLVLSTLQEISLMHTDFPSIILDIIGILDAETSTGLNTDGAPDRGTFCQIIKEVEKFLSEKLLKERLEIDTLQDVGTIKNKTFYTKFIKVKTKLYYKQRRFNLFREESEGYAKLITELNQDPTTNVSVDHLLKIITSLIGCFNLDPNRVLDIILESFETRPEQNKLFIGLLKAYMPNGNIICEVLGYKYRHFSDSKTPSSLYVITALLLQSKIISLDDIYSWLSPTDKSIQIDWETDLDDAKEYVRKLNVISINNNNKEPEAEVEKEENDDKYATNQKWNLCEALLHVGDWQTAQKLIEKLPKYSVLVRENVALALCDLIHRVIDPVYVSKCSVTPSRKERIYTSNTNKLSTPQAKSLFDLRVNAFPMAVQLGPSLFLDPVLLYKLVRLCRVILTDMSVDPSTSPKTPDDELLYFDIMTLLDSSILPALSYMECNCCVAEEIWSVVKFLPYHIRYSLYGRWKNDTFLVHPKLIRRRGAAQKKIKALMKRVSKENVKPVGRSIGKLSHCSPGFLFDYILIQIQIYDNLIGPVVDSLKYLTSLSYDVLGYCLIEALAQADKNRFKHDGTSISMWLQSSANFCGSIYKKYNIELSGLLQYVANQLKSHKSLDLLILKEVVQKMTGIEATEEMTLEQLNAMSGGELLRSEAGYFSQVRNTKKSSLRLKEALASNDLAVTLCLLMAQQKHCVIYRETAHSHLKLVGKLYDQCQDTLVQFGTFLGSTYSVDEYMERLPSIHSMLQEYHIHSDVAFFLARPMFTHQINQKYDQLRKADTSTKKLSTVQKQEKYLEATSAIISPIVESVRPLHPSKVWEDISPQFLVTFWSLSMYDLLVPVDSYQKEIQKIKEQSLSVLDSKDMNLSKGRKEQERYLALIDKLQDERKKQTDHVEKIMHRLNQEKDSWFLSRSAKSAKNETITQFLQLCLFPRCTFTAMDAVYCAKFVHTIHTLKTANFSTLLCYDRIFCDITYSVTSCTENEATRYGRFLCAMLETVMRWHKSSQTFNSECANFPGFVTKFRVSNQFSEANDHVGYENYRHVCHKWHYKITKAMVFCLESKDYMQIRNALIILMRILPHFPMLVKLAQIIERKVEKVREEEKNKRQDLFVLASSYIGQLKTRSADMVHESQFHQVADKPNKEVAETSKPSVNGNATEPKEPVVEKKIKPIAAPAEKEVKKERESNGKVQEPPVVVLDKKSSKEQKREEKQREKEEKEIETRKRDRDRSEKRRDRKTASPATNYYDLATNDRYYTTDQYEPTDRERDRDLSSISNSSNGSTNRRQESPDHDRVKRRKVDSSLKKSLDDGPIIFDDTKKERTTKSKDKKEKSWDDGDVRKEKKVSRKREK
ncbi:THO complex subunit 2 isoform X2 [Bradysia coprophila]|uniref:THO complex subunit 2 isoform X2 n=1 Tax=Bradysia coprophila TaxID=38358 RepID=UPI00187DCFAE|nr:THO complex subunit 2 isoform X2 [Bradysia coprophila]